MLPQCERSVELRESSWEHSQTSSFQFRAARTDRIYYSSMIGYFKAHFGCPKRPDTRHFSALHLPDPIRENYDGGGGPTCDFPAVTVMIPMRTVSVELLPAAGRAYHTVDSLFFPCSAPVLTCVQPHPRRWCWSVPPSFPPDTRFRGRSSDKSGHSGVFCVQEWTSPLW
jgi:hypothetical protein